MKTLLPILLVFIPILVSAQIVEKHAKVSLQIDRSNFVQYLNENGLDIDHSHKIGKNQLETIITHSELELLENLEIQYQVLVDDVAQEYENNFLQSGGLVELDCGLSNFDSGEMGGYHSYADMIEHINLMASSYPELVSTSIIGTSIEGRSIYAVKISDNVNADESLQEGVVYYDAITHAREPMGLETVLFYMWTLLENYGSDPKYTYLVDNREMYFVPIVNPDGYVYNQTTNPNGGGLWRKNRRDNGDDCFGIDLNRNYSYEWGNPAGSSGNICAGNYRGEAPFSEPESQAVRDFTADIQPAAAYSCHTYSDVFLCPNGFNNELEQYEDYAEFASEALPEFYKGYGNWIQMIGYFGAGTTHDYLNNQGTIAYTPEIGHDFWESPNVICDRIQEMLPAMEYLSWVSGNYACFHDFKLLEETPIWDGRTNSIQIRIKNRGLSKVAQNVSVELSTDHPAITFEENTINYGDIAPRQFADNETNPFIFSVSSMGIAGDEIEIFVKVFQDGALSYEDVIYLYSGDTNTSFIENCEDGTSQWSIDNNSNWDTTFMDAFNGNHSITDSRYGNFSSNTNTRIELLNPFHLYSATQPWLEFQAKWSLEPNSDFVRVLISTDGGTNWAPLQGQYTTLINNSPGYTNNKHWVQERINLAAYIGMENLLIAFSLQTDSGVQGDGFYFDDLKIIDYFIPDMVAVSENENADLNFNIFPNPAQDELNIKFLNNISSEYELTLFGLQGRAILSQISNSQKTTLSLKSIPNGVYWLRIKSNQFSGMQKVIVLNN